MVTLTKPSEYDFRVRYRFHLRRRALRRLYQKFLVHTVEYYFQGEHGDSSLYETRYFDSTGVEKSIGKIPPMFDVDARWLYESPGTTFQDQIPRVMKRHGYFVESDLGFDLMYLCGETGWDQYVGGSALVAWDIPTDIFDLKITGLKVIEDVCRHSRFEGNRVTEYTEGKLNG